MFAFCRVCCKFVSIALFFILLVNSLFGCTVQSRDQSHTEIRRAVYYKTQKGDTITKISKRYSIPVQNLLRLNRISEADRFLVPGKKVLLGYKRSRAVSPKAGYASHKFPSAAKGKSHLAWPLEEGRIVSGFGPRNGTFHDGLDIAVPAGTPVYAAHDGRVIYAASGIGGYGKLVIIRGVNRLISFYAHNQEILVEDGEDVKQGDLIAMSGSSGRASGAHLHFEVRMIGPSGRYVAVDPQPLLEGGNNRPRWRVNEGLNAILAQN